MLMSASIASPYLAPPMYEYLCGWDVTSISVADLDVPNYEVRELLRCAYITCVLYNKIKLHLIFSYS